MNTATPTIAALLGAIRSEPHNRLHRLVLADALEEAGDERRAKIARAVQPKMQAVMERVWPGCRMVWVGYSSNPLESVEEIQTKRGKRIMYVRDLCEMIEDHTLLSDPDVLNAAEIERGLAVLKLFAKEKQ